jgi:DNA-3-methyladenine glycosylase
MRVPRGRLARRFYARETLVVARDLLGMHLVHRRPDGTRAAGRIVETEAYIGEEDLACHASKGRTRRTQVMFGPPGHAYVFIIYGVHPCFNVVTERDGFPAAVLVRAVEPGEGVARTTDGPGKVCAALGIAREHSGVDLCGELLWIEQRGTPPARIAVTERINVDYAGAWARKPWRFVDADSPHLSKRLPGSPRRRARAV